MQNKIPATFDILIQSYIVRHRKGMQDVFPVQQVEAQTAILQHLPWRIELYCDRQCCYFEDNNASCIIGDVAV